MKKTTRKFRTFFELCCPRYRVEGDLYHYSALVKARCLKKYYHIDYRNGRCRSKIIFRFSHTYAIFLGVLSPLVLAKNALWAHLSISIAARSRRNRAAIYHLPYEIFMLPSVDGHLYYLMWQPQDDVNGYDYVDCDD